MPHAAASPQVQIKKSISYARSIKLKRINQFNYLSAFGNWPHKSVESLPRSYEWIIIRIIRSHKFHDTFKLLSLHRVHRQLSSARDRREWKYLRPPSTARLLVKLWIEIGGMSSLPYGFMVRFSVGSFTCQHSSNELQKSELGEALNHSFVCTSSLRMSNTTKNIV